MSWLPIVHAAGENQVRSRPCSAAGGMVRQGWNTLVPDALHREESARRRGLAYADGAGDAASLPGGNRRIHSLFLFLLLVSILRSRIAATAAFVGLSSFLIASDSFQPILTVMFVAAAGCAVIALLLLRFGLLAFASLLFVVQLTKDFPLTLYASAWFFPASPGVLAILAAIGAWAIACRCRRAAILEGRFLMRAEANHTHAGCNPGSGRLLCCATCGHSRNATSEVVMCILRPTLGPEFTVGDDDPHRPHPGAARTLCKDQSRLGRCNPPVRHLKIRSVDRRRCVSTPHLTPNLPTRSLPVNRIASTI